MARRTPRSTRTRRPAPAIPATGRHIEQLGPSDYIAYYDGAIIGARPTRWACDELLNDHIHQLLVDGVAGVAGELAAGVAQ